MLDYHRVIRLAALVLAVVAMDRCRTVLDCSGWGGPNRAIAACNDSLRLFEWYASLRHAHLARNFAWAHFHLAVAYSEKGHLDRAMADLTRSIEALPTAGAHLLRAQLAARRGDAAAAEADLAEALRLEPDNPAVREVGEELQSALARRRLAALLARCRSGSFDTMLPACEAALAEPAIGPVRKAMALAARGLVHSYRDRLDDAARDLAEATRLDPGKPAYHATYGDILRKQGRNAEAAAAYRAALALDDDFAPARAGLAALGPVPPGERPARSRRSGRPSIAARPTPISAIPASWPSATVSPWTGTASNSALTGIRMVTSMRLVAPGAARIRKPKM